MKNKTITLILPNMESNFKFNYLVKIVLKKNP